MECVDFSLNLDRCNILLAVIYRPPDSSVLQFANELAAYMEKNINTTGEQIIVGDLNVHINKQDEGNAIILSDMLESFNLTNHVGFPTDKLQNTLDLVINQQDSKHIRNVCQDTFSLIIIWSYLILHLKAKFHSQESRPLGNTNPSIWKISQMMWLRN